MNFSQFFQYYSVVWIKSRSTWFAAVYDNNWKRFFTCGYSGLSWYRQSKYLSCCGAVGIFLVVLPKVSCDFKVFIKYRCENVVSPSKYLSGICAKSWYWCLFLKYRLDKYSSCQDTVAEPLWLNLLLFICLFLSEEMKYCCNQKQHVWLKRKKVPSMFEPGNKEKNSNVYLFF